MLHLRPNLLQFDFQDAIWRRLAELGVTPSPNNIGGGPIAIFNTCPFCEQRVNWDLGALTKIEDGLKPVTYTPRYLDCPRCGRIASICQVSEDEQEVSLRFIHGSSALDDLSKFLASLSGGSVDASEKIAYGVLGGLTKDGISRLYHTARKKEGTTTFEQDLEQVLEQYRMRLCSFCNRPVKKKDTFCIHCGRALR